VKCIWKRQWLASQSLTAGVLWVARLSQMDARSSSAGTALSIATRELLELDGAMPAMDLTDHGAVGDVERREQAGDAVPGVVCGCAAQACPASIGSTGWERSSACICDFSSTHNTTAFSGGLWYKPTTSTTLSTNIGSLESLNPSSRCGLRSNRCQIRPIVVGDSPVRAAIDVRDQCVAFARLLLQGRHHHLFDLVQQNRTVADPAAARPPDHRGAGPQNVDATCSRCWAPPPEPRRLACSLPQVRHTPNTIRDRNANAWDASPRRDHRISWSRSSVVKHQLGLRPPRSRHNDNHTELTHEFTVRHTSSASASLEEDQRVPATTPGPPQVPVVPPYSERTSTSLHGQCTTIRSVCRFSGSTLAQVGTERQLPRFCTLVASSGEVMVSRFSCLSHSPRRRGRMPGLPDVLPGPGSEAEARQAVWWASPRAYPIRVGARATAQTMAAGEDDCLIVIIKS